MTLAGCQRTPQKNNVLHTRPDQEFQPLPVGASNMFPEKALPSPHSSERSKPRPACGNDGRRTMEKRQIPVLVATNSGRRGAERDAAIQNQGFYGCRRLETMVCATQRWLAKSYARLMPCVLIEGSDVSLRIRHYVKLLALRFYRVLVQPCPDSVLSPQRPVSRAAHDALRCPHRW